MYCQYIVFNEPSKYTRNLIVTITKNEILAVDNLEIKSIISFNNERKKNAKVERYLFTNNMNICESGSIFYFCF